MFSGIQGSAQDKRRPAKERTTGVSMCVWGWVCVRVCVCVCMWVYVSVCVCVLGMGREEGDDSSNRQFGLTGTEFTNGRGSTQQIGTKLQWIGVTRWEQGNYTFLKDKRMNWEKKKKKERRWTCLAFVSKKSSFWLGSQTWNWITDYW